jgi:hypothetical protein
VPELFEGLCEPGAGAEIEAGDGQIGFVFGPVEVGFVQEGKLGAEIGNAVDGVQGSLPGHADARVALKYPLGLAGVKQQVQLPRMLGVAARP